MLKTKPTHAPPPPKFKQPQHANSHPSIPFRCRHHNHALPPPHTSSLFLPLPLLPPLQRVIGLQRRLVCRFVGEVSWGNWTRSGWQRLRVLILFVEHFVNRTVGEPNPGLQKNSTHQHHFKTINVAPYSPASSWSSSFSANSAASAFSLRRMFARTIKQEALPADEAVHFSCKNDGYFRYQGSSTLTSTGSITPNNMINPRTAPVLARFCNTPPATKAATDEMILFRVGRYGSSLAAFPHNLDFSIILCFHLHELFHHKIA